MLRLSAAVAISTLALSGAVAEAAKKPNPRAKVYSATLAPTNPSAYAGITGKAQMVDNKKRDSAKIQVQGLLPPGSTYYWVIYKANAGKPPCDPSAAGQGVEAFRYKSLKVNSAGNASATAKSRTFVGFTTTRYVVAVRNSEDVVVACGLFKLKKAKKGKG